MVYLTFWPIKLAWIGQFCLINLGANRFLIFRNFPRTLLSPSLFIPFPRLLSHRIIIRQIRLSAASLHDMPSLACGASLAIRATLR